MLDTNRPEARFALEGVRQACYLVRQIQAEMANATLTKTDLSPVTVGDYAAQALIGCLLERAFPNDALLAEEDSTNLCRPEQEELLVMVTGFINRILPGARPESVCAWIDRGRTGPARRFWTLDPIDGTKGYLRGDQYVVALALIEDAQVELGVLGCPNLSDAFRPDPGGPGSLVIAARGEGAWTTSLASALEFDRLSVSERADPAMARMLRSFEAMHTNVRLIDELVQALGVMVEPARMDSQAKYAVLAAGKGEVLVRLVPSEKPAYREKIWDVAPGAIVVEEAGGRITDLHGKELDFSAGRELMNNRGVLVSNGRLHAAFIDALRSLGV